MRNPSESLSPSGSEKVDSPYRSTFMVRELGSWPRASPPEGQAWVTVSKGSGGQDGSVKDSMVNTDAGGASAPGTAAWPSDGRLDVEVTRRSP